MMRYLLIAAWIGVGHYLALQARRRVRGGDYTGDPGMFKRFVVPTLAGPLLLLPSLLQSRSLGPDVFKQGVLRTMNTRRPLSTRELVRIVSVATAALVALSALLLLFM